VKILKDFYVYPWVSYEENNCNSIFIDGRVPILVDPGHANLVGPLLEGMTGDGLAPDVVKLVVCTHGHPDHIEAVDRFDEDVLKAITKEEYQWLTKGYGELFLMSGSRTPQKPFQLFLKDGTARFGDKTFRIILTPGHSPGSACLFWEEERVLISGDTVFYMGVGRTDLYGGDSKALARSIQALAKLDAEYLIPGHGQMLKGKKAIKENFRMILEEFF
jgi:hydroxyacylglutathione hydrolase